MTDDRMALELSLRAFWLCFFSPARHFLQLVAST